MIVGIIRRKPVLTHAGIVFGGMLASVNLVNTVNNNNNNNNNNIIIRKFITRTCSQALSLNWTHVTVYLVVDKCHL